MSTQVPPQALCPVGHISDARHAPAMHVCPEAQALPQPPQFVASVIVSVHTPAQRVWPAVLQGVSAAHVPPEHVWPEGHALPHAPQFIASVSTSMQVPPQRA